MKHKLVTYDGSDLGIVYLYGPIPYIGYTFTLNDKGFKVLGIQGAAFTEMQNKEIEIVLVVVEVPRIY